MRASWMRLTVTRSTRSHDRRQRDRQRVHREAGVDAGAEHRDLRLLRQRVHLARLAGCACSPDTTAPRSSRRSRVFAFSIASICGITALIDELGAVARRRAAWPLFSARAASSDDLARPARRGRPTTSPRSRPTFAGSISMAPTILKPGRRGDLPRRRPRRSARGRSASRECWPWFRNYSAAATGRREDKVGTTTGTCATRLEVRAPLRT